MTVTTTIDLVARLRLWHGATGDEAAEEIERLRAQVEDLTRIVGCMTVATAIDLPIKTLEDIKQEAIK